MTKSVDEIMKVRYIGKDIVALEKGKIYDVISIERGWYRILTELEEDYLFPPGTFDIVDESDRPEDVWTRKDITS